MIKERVGNYICDGSLGRGSYGNVYHASHIDPHSPRQVAIKLFYNTDDSDRYESTFRREVNILNRFHHNHIVQIYDHGIQKRPDGTPRPYVIMEYAAGGSLRQRLDREFVLPIETTIHIISQIADALFYAHEQGIVHGDLKPENILFSTPERALLADFGISVVLHAQTKEKIFAGTYCYMPPEQFRHEAGRESDQYALACIAYEMLTGQRPFPAETSEALLYQHLHEYPPAAHDINPQVPATMNRVLQRGLAKERHDRYPSVRAFCEALEQALHFPVQAPSTQQSRPSRRSFDFDDADLDDFSFFEDDEELQEDRLPESCLRVPPTRIHKNSAIKRIESPASKASPPLPKRILDPAQSWQGKRLIRAAIPEPNSPERSRKVRRSRHARGRIEGYDPESAVYIPRASRFDPCNSIRHAPASVIRLNPIMPRVRPPSPPVKQTLWQWLSLRQDRFPWFCGSSLFTAIALGLDASQLLLWLFSLLALFCVLMLFRKNERFQTHQNIRERVKRMLVVTVLMALFIIDIITHAEALNSIIYVALLLFWSYEEVRAFFERQS